MEIKDLNPTERVALVALVRASVLSDGALSETETAEYDLLVTEMGEESYREAAAVATERVYDDASLRRLLEAVTRTGAREVIYGTLFQISTAETVTRGESRLLELVGKMWGLDPKFVDFPEPAADGAPDSDDAPDFDGGGGPARAKLRDQ